MSTQVWQRPLLQDASVAARMRRNKYVALADILPPAIVKALQIYYRNIIQNKYKVRFAEKTRRWEFEEAPLANLVNLLLTDVVSAITGQQLVQNQLTRFQCTACRVDTSEITQLCNNQTKPGANVRVSGVLRGGWAHLAAS